MRNVYGSIWCLIVTFILPFQRHQFGSVEMLMLVLYLMFKKQSDLVCIVVCAHILQSEPAIYIFFEARMSRWNNKRSGCFLMDWQGRGENTRREEDGRKALTPFYATAQHCLFSKHLKCLTHLVTVCENTFPPLIFQDQLAKLLFKNSLLLFGNVFIFLLISFFFFPTENIENKKNKKSEFQSSEFTVHSPKLPVLNLPWSNETPEWNCEFDEMPWDVCTLRNNLRVSG